MADDLGSDRQPNESRDPGALPSLPAAALTAALNDPTGILGLQAESPIALPTAVVHTIVWEWSDPVEAILRFTGWSWDDLEVNAAARAEVSGLMRLFQEAAEIRRRDEAEHEAATLRWQRQQGCPV